MISYNKNTQVEIFILAAFDDIEGFQKAVNEFLLKKKVLGIQMTESKDGISIMIHYERDEKYNA